MDRTFLKNAHLQSLIHVNIFPRGAQGIIYPPFFSPQFCENPKTRHLQKAPRWPSCSGEMSDVPANLSRGENDRKKREKKGVEIVCLNGVEDFGKQKENITERHQLSENMQGQGLGLVVSSHAEHMFNAWRTCGTHRVHVGRNFAYYVVPRPTNLQKYSNPNWKDMHILSYAVCIYKALYKCLMHIDGMHHQKWQFAQILVIRCE